MDKIQLDLKDSIADTLLITLYAKAVETVKKDPLIHDDLACQLVEKIDYDFSKYKNYPATSVGVAIRANHFDQMVKQFIQTHQQPVVVFIGCGLDARIQRIAVDSQHCQFYQLDIAEVIKLRKALIPLCANEHLIESSMLDTNWMDQLKQQHPEAEFMFVIEGVLMYFSEQQNQMFFKALADRFTGAEIHFDMLNKWMSTKTAIHSTVRQTKAVFKFGIDNERIIEQWHPRLRHTKTYLYLDFKGWRRMGFVLAQLMSVLPQFKTASRILIYKVI